MSNISIAINNSNSDLYNDIIKNINTIANSFSFYDIPNSNFTVLNLNKNDSNYNLILDLITDFIIDIYEDKLLSRIINTNYCYFSLEEKKGILDTAKAYLHQKENELYEFYKNRNHNLVKNDLKIFIDDNNNEYIFLDGFVNFRIKGYILELEDIVDKAVDSYLIKCEYDDFVDLLKYIVSLQIPKIDDIHIKKGTLNKYSIFDSNNNDITSFCLQDFITDIPLNESDINYDDLLISSLISLAPKNIFIYSLEDSINKDLLKTLKLIFENRLHIL